jgi:hypothetical protein
LLPPDAVKKKPVENTKVRENALFTLPYGAKQAAKRKAEQCTALFMSLFSRLSQVYFLTSFNYQHLTPLASDSRLISFNHQQLPPLGSDYRLTSFNYQHLTPLASDSLLNSFNHQRPSALASISRLKSSHC